MAKTIKKCPHGKRKQYCAPCGGGSVCKHGRRKAVCPECDGSGLCRHRRVMSQCLLCGGSAYCKHGKRKAACRECGGTGICRHGQHKHRCRECQGSSICRHGKDKHYCIPCGGSGMCQHGTERRYCGECNEFICNIEGCSMRGHRFAGANSLLGHMRSAHGDNPKALTKHKELEVHQLLTEAGLIFEYQHHLPFRGCGLESETARAFADFVLYTPWGAIILEVDEHQHSHQDPSCDVRRDFDMAASVALGSQHKLAIVRYNPDGFKVAGRTVRTAKNTRHSKLLELLHSLIQEEPERPFQRLFLFYDRAAEDSELPTVAEEWDVVARTVSRAVQ